MPVQIAIGTLITCPLLICQKLVYQPQDHYYSVPMSDTFGYLWVILGSYGLPVLYISNIYIRIMLFIHRQINNLTLVAQRREQRSLLAVKRILLNILALTTIEIPGFILYIFYLITHVEYPLTQRIVCLSTELGIAVGTVGIIWITPQLRSIIIGLWRRNQIIPITTS